MGRGPEHLGGSRRRRRIRNTVAGVTALAAATYGVAQVDNPFGIPEFFRNLNRPHLNVGNNPPEASASVRPSTVEVEKKLKVSCEGQISIGVGADGVKDELMANGNFDKVIFGDFWACGEKGEVLANARITADVATGKVTKVSVETAGLEVMHPRVDFTDPRNCAKTSAKNNDAKNKAIIDKLTQDLRANKKVKCDDGFSVSGLFGGSDLAKIIPTANAAAQIAMALDAQSSEVMEKMNVDFMQDLRNDLERQYPGAEVNVQQALGIVSARDRLDRVSKELEQNFYKVSFGLKDGQPAMNVSAPGGGKVNVKVVSIDSRRAVIERIEAQNAA